MQDFPKLKSPGQQLTALARDFLDTLSDYLRHSHVIPEFLKDYDYSNAKVVLISSVPGFHKGEKVVQKYGHAKVRMWLAREQLPNLAPGTTETVMLQCSSIGSLSSQWLNGEFLSSLAAGRITKPRSLPQAGLVWPTTEYVRNCIDGYMAGGSLCCNLKNMKDFMRPLLRRYQPLMPVRGPIPPHIKTYFRIASDSSLSWAMTTSANMSTGAWGHVQQNGQQIMLRNYEIGVLFLPSLIKEALQVENVTLFADRCPSVTPVTNSSARVAFPLPYAFPPAKYGPNDQTWAWDVQHRQPDVYGLRWPPDPSNM